MDIYFFMNQNIGAFSICACCLCLSVLALIPLPLPGYTSIAL